MTSSVSEVRPSAPEVAAKEAQPPPQNRLEQRERPPPPDPQSSGSGDPDKGQLLDKVA